MSKRQRTPSSTNLVPLLVRLPPELHAWLKEQAEKERRSMNSQIAVLLQSIRDVQVSDSVKVSESVSLVVTSNSTES